MSQGLADLWPAAGVRALAGDLELRWIDDGLLVELAELAAKGVHEPGRMPFRTPWTRGSADEVMRSVFEYQWVARTRLGARGPLTLEYAVLLGGRVVGVQGASGTDWPVLRSVETGSWLGLEFQGHGIGTRMRALMLHLLFDGLGAVEVTSVAFEDNPASNAVSVRTGYLANGTTRVARESAPMLERRYAMAKPRWDEVRAETMAMLGATPELIGVQRLRQQLGG